MAVLPATGRAVNLWKCTTADGGVAYVNNHKSDYKRCRKVHVPQRAGSTQVEDKPAPKGEWQYRDTRADEPPPAAPVAPAADKQPTRVVRGAVYRVKRSDGVVEYTNVRPRGRRGRVAVLFHYISTCRACEVNSGVDWASVPLHVDDYREQVRLAAREYGVDAGLLRALIHAESGFDPRALSVKGAQGLTQLMPATARMLGVTDAFNPLQNIRGGAHYLARMLKRFGGNERLAAAAYNAGPGAVEKYNGIPPYAETRVYVQRVQLLAQRYRKALGDGGTVAGAAGTAAAQ